MHSERTARRCAHGALPGEGSCSCVRADKASGQIATTRAAQLESVMDALPFYLMLIDESHTVLYANQATRDALGLAPEELVGAYCPTAVHGLTDPYPNCPLEEAAGRYVTVEREFCDPAAGGWLSSAVYPAPLRTSDGKMAYAHLVQSIDQRKRAEHALRERLEMETLVASVTTRLLSAPPGSLLAELQATLATVAKFMGSSACALYLADEAGAELVREVAWTSGQDAVSLPLGLSPDCLAASLPDEVTASLGSAAAARALAAVPLSLDGRRVGLGLFVGSAPAARLDDESLHELLGITLSAACDRLRNVRQQQRHTALLRSLATELAAVEERERRELAADLHDSIGQTLALCIMNLANLEQSGLVGEPGRVVAETRAHIEDALVGAKTLMFDLSPPSLHELGIVGALEALLERLGPRFELDWELRQDGSPMPLGEDQRAFLFRAVQELVTNVSKHANATRIGVRLWREDETVAVEVSDDGRGMAEIDPCSGAVAVPRFGLFSIRERLHHLGGHMSVSSAAGAGTQVTIKMPVSG